MAEASQALPEVIERRPGFERAVSAFVEAIKGLPEELTSEALVAAGPNVLSEYQNAREAASVIASIYSWLAGLINLPAYAGVQTSPALRMLSAENRGELAKLRAAHQNRNADPLEIELGKLYLAAAREGIEFSLNTLTYQPRSARASKTRRVSRQGASLTPDESVSGPTTHDPDEREAAFQSYLRPQSTTSKPWKLRAIRRGSAG